MNHSLRLFAIAGAILLAASCGPAKTLTTNTAGFPLVDQGGKIAIVAHRGFWKSEQGGMSENSIASLRAAQDAGLWGSECDIHLTADGIVIVNHDPSIAGKSIRTHNYSDFAQDLLPNGEHRPTLDEYLVQTSKCKTTKLVIEFKKQGSDAVEDELVDKTIAALKAHKLYDPERVLFISFSKHICEVLAKTQPQFINQYLSSDPTGIKEEPSNYSVLGINGIDYHYKMFKAHPDWVKSAHDKGMSVNAWTVNKEDDIRRMIEIGVDAITTNEPLLVRDLLGDKEYKKKQ